MKKYQSSILAIAILSVSILAPTIANADNSDNLNLVSADQGVNVITAQSGQDTTVRFTAKYNDGRADAHYSWTFPANEQVTYGQLFNLAGLNINDFDLNDYNFDGMIPA